MPGTPTSSASKSTARPAVELAPSRLSAHCRRQIPMSGRWGPEPGGGHCLKQSSVDVQRINRAAGILQGDRGIAFGRVEVTRAVQPFGGMVGGPPSVNAGQRLSCCSLLCAGRCLQRGGFE